MLTSKIGQLIIALVILITIVLQYIYWFGHRGYYQHQELTQKIQLQKEQNEEAREQNRILAADVYDLKNGKEAIEEHARLDLGLIKANETFVQTDLMIEPAAVSLPTTSASSQDISALKK